MTTTFTCHSSMQSSYDYCNTMSHTTAIVLAPDPAWGGSGTETIVVVELAMS